MVGTVERLAKETTSPESPYSQAYFIFVQDKEIPSYSSNQTACVSHATFIPPVTETHNFNAKPITSFRGYSHMID